MAVLGKKFNAQEHDTDNQAGDFEDLPAGILRFEIEASDVVETGPENARTGNGMKYTANVLAPAEIEGRKFFGFINLENDNAQAQEIGQKEFACLCRAIGVSEVEDTEELHLKSYTVKLGMGKPSKKKDANGVPLYPARMEVKKYFFPDEGNVPDPEIDAVQPAKAAPVANDNKRPAANNNRPAPAAANQAAASSGKARPWGGKK
ncbi:MULTISPECIES: DUF669 domain-containing protein [unclassified Mesorhizobium]|uniref:DUF669 domain-containing protein n=1 Tax=unclassified Mesorhizobium TaxID=325217 RepID=UPI0003CF30CA|nr:DUF669 domain-containing protein [Mesorhizobium sp. LSHC414A00]ESX78266.1 hypothetical protein X757_09155 [Mesorhizobium sp. LSHC414A00]